MRRSGRLRSCGPTLTGASSPTVSVHLRDVMLWDGTEADPRPADVTIVDGRVAAMLPSGAAAGDEAVVLDLQGAFVQPGLVDMHVHLVYRT
jgi:imidazolonepropionase-like amidohydrolase